MWAEGVGDAIANRPTDPFPVPLLGNFNCNFLRLPRLAHFVENSLKMTSKKFAHRPVSICTLYLTHPNPSTPFIQSEWLGLSNRSSV